MKNSILEFQYLGKTYFMITYKIIKSEQGCVVKFSTQFLDADLNKIDDENLQYELDEFMGSDWLGYYTNKQF